MAQQRGLGQILPAGQRHRRLPLLRRGHGHHPHLQILVEALGEPQRHAAPPPDHIGLLLRQRHHIVPRVAVDELADVAVLAGGLELRQLGGRHILQKLRGQHRLISVAHSGVRSRRLGGDGGGAGQRVLQRLDLPFHRLDLRLDLLLGGVGMVPFQHSGLQLGDVALRGGVVAAGEGLPQRQDVAGDGGVQLQRRIGVQIGGQRELQLLQLQLQRLDLAHGLQGPVVGVDTGQHLAHAYVLALLPHTADRAALGGQRLLVPHHPAVQRDGVLCLPLRHQRGGDRVGQVVVQLHGKIDEHRRQHGDGQYFHEGRCFFHGAFLCLVCCSPRRTLCLRRLVLPQLHGPHRRDGGDGVLVDDLLPALGVQNDHEAVEAGDDAPQLEPVDQEHGHGDVLLAGAGEKDLLKVVCLLHIVCSFMSVCGR